MLKPNRFPKCLSCWCQIPVSMATCSELRVLLNCTAILLSLWKKNVRRNHNMMSLKFAEIFLCFHARVVISHAIMTVVETHLPGKKKKKQIQRRTSWRITLVMLSCLWQMLGPFIWSSLFTCCAKDGCTGLMQSLVKWQKLYVEARRALVPRMPATPEDYHCFNSTVPTHDICIWE